MTGSLLFRCLGALAGRAPRVAYGVTSVVAALSQPFRRTVARDDLASLFPHLSEKDLDAALRHNWRSQLLSRTLKEGVYRRGAAAVTGIVTQPPFDDLRPPAILATVHLGPLHAIASVVEALAIGTLSFRLETDAAGANNAIIAETNDDEMTRAAAFYNAVRALRAGQFALVTLEPDQGAHIEVALFGRTMRFARGPFALARVTGAPLIPLVARWTGRRVEIIRGETIAAFPDESVSAAAAAAWLEQYLGEHPEEMKERMVALFNGSLRR